MLLLDSVLMARIALNGKTVCESLQDFSIQENPVKNILGVTPLLCAQILRTIFQCISVKKHPLK